MDLNIYYDIRNNGKNEFIRTNDKIIQNYIEKAQEYYKLKINMGIDGFVRTDSFKIGDFVLYMLSNDTNFDNDSNMKIKLIKQYLEECINNKKYFDIPIFLGFIRDILQIQELEFIAQYYASNYYNNEDISKEINIKTKLSTFDKNKKNINIDKTYVCKNVVMLILVSLFEVMRINNKIHKCINCGKIFINNSIDKNTRYCNYISPQNKGKTCFQYRKNATYQEVRKNDEIKKIHNDIYNFLNKRRKRVEEKSTVLNPYKNDERVKECQRDLENFKHWYEEKTREYKNGNLTREQFIELLKEQDKKYKEERKNGSTRNNKK